MTTPDFTPWAGGFARQLQRLRSTSAPTLHQFELIFSLWIPHWRLAQQDEGKHSRNRLWNLRLAFWTFLWQVAQAGASCREAVCVSVDPVSHLNIVHLAEPLPLLSFPVVQCSDVTLWLPQHSLQTLSRQVLFDTVPGVVRRKHLGKKVLGLI